MIKPESAWERIEQFLSPLNTETAARSEALGRVLAKSLVATLDVPAQDVSAMDGYAIVGELEIGHELAIEGTIAAGDPPGAILSSDRALRIMTGAPVPDGADRILPVEQTELTASGLVQIQEAVPKAAHIRRRAEILAAGSSLLSEGTLLTPGGISLLATHGYHEVEVFRRPRVSTLATGDEVVNPESRPGPGQLRDSHTDFLCAAGQSLGLAFDALGIAPDDPQEIGERIEQGMDADVLLVTGGVSMGEFDYVEGALVRLGCQVLFDAVAIQPGKPLVVARHPGGWVFGLPGNPASVMVGFWLFVRPLLRRLQGIPDAFWDGALRAELAAPLPGAKGRDRFLAARVRFESSRLLVWPMSAKGSHDLAAYAHGSALVRVPAHADPTPAGEPCEIIPLVDWPQSAASARNESADEGQSR